MLRQIERKLITTKGKVSKEWLHYRKTKRGIMARKRLAPDLKKQIIASELDATRQKISKTWTGYKEQKYSIIHKSPYANFSFVRTQVGVRKEVDGEEQFFRFNNTYQKIFKAGRKFDTDRLDEIVPQVLDQSNVQGVLLVFEIYNPEEDTSQVVSNYITRELMDIIEELDESVFEYVTQRFQGYGNYELKFIYMRVIYKVKK